MTNPAATQPTPSATQQQSAAAQPNTHPAPTPAAPSTISVKEKGYSEKDFEGWQPMKMLGKGSFGAVYEAGLRSGKIVCVKIVELGSIANPDDMTKLRNEISLMRRLHHPNIVQYYGCVEDKAKNTLNIFMEYVTGGSKMFCIFVCNGLAQLSKTCRRDVDEAKTFCRTRVTII